MGGRLDQEAVDMRDKIERHKDEEDEKGKKDLQTDRQSQREREREKERERKRKRELNWVDPSNRKLLTKNEGIYLFSILPSLVVMSCGQLDEDEDEDEEDELQNKIEIET